MSSTYTISQFISFCDVLPVEVVQIVSKDNWFKINSTNDIKRFVKFIITNNTINFFDRSNEPKDGYIEIDKTFDIANIDISTVLNINQLASIIFSVNGNKLPFIMVRNFLKKLKNDEIENYNECIGSKRMQIFCSHLAYIHSNIPKDSSHIPEWLKKDSLFEEEIFAWERMHPKYKFSIVDIPSFDIGSRIFISPLFLCFIMTFDKYCGGEIDKTLKIINGIRLDLEKFQNVKSLI